jgi:thiol-disulfide isomerase/thioredoxin
MQRFVSSHRHALAALSILLTLATLACQQKSVLDNPAASAPTPEPPRPTPTQMALKIEHETSQPSAATAATVIPSQPAAVNATPAPPLPGGPLAATQGQDFELVLLDASKLKLSKLLGRRKVVVINFWATWCGPCRREIPELIALQKDYSNNKDVEIFGLSVEDPQQFREQVKGFAKQFEINYKVGFSPIPMFMTFNGTDPRAPIPQTFVFGKDGKLMQHIKGMRPAFKDFIQQTVDLALKSS